MGKLPRILLPFVVLIVAAEWRPVTVDAAGPPGSHYRLDGNKNGTWYSATIGESGRGIWIGVHTRESSSGTFIGAGYRGNTSYASAPSVGLSYRQTGSAAGSNPSSAVVRSWTNAEGEPYYETSSGAVYHLSGLNFGSESEGPNGWLTVGMHQHPGSVPEALSINGHFQGIVWVPINGKGGGIQWGTPPPGNGNGQGSAPIVVDPRVVAMNVLSHIPLPSVHIRMNPSLGLVGLQGWFWGEGFNGQPFGGAASIGGITVAVQVQPVSYTWSFGDGTTLISHDLGQPYPAESDVKHTYQYSSLHYPKGFPVSLTIQFAATYSVNGGAAQALSGLEGTYTAAYRVQELQAILTNQ